MKMKKRYWLVIVVVVGWFLFGPSEKDKVPSIHEVVIISLPIAGDMSPSHSFEFLKFPGPTFRIKDLQQDLEIGDRTFLETSMLTVYYPSGRMVSMKKAYVHARDWWNGEDQSSPGAVPLDAVETLSVDTTKSKNTDLFYW